MKYEDMKVGERYVDSDGTVLFMLEHEYNDFKSVLVSENKNKNETATGDSWFECCEYLEPYTEQGEKEMEFVEKPEVGDNPWIENTGGCPVEIGTLIDVKYKKGCVTLGIPALIHWNDNFNSSSMGSDWDATDWSIDSSVATITHWRLHKPVVTAISEPAIASDNVVEADTQDNKENAAEGFKTAGKPISSDGGSSDYYKLTIKTKDGEFKCEAADLMRSLFDNDYSYSNVFKALLRMKALENGCGKAGNTLEYDANKVKWFTDDILSNYNKENE